VRKKRRAVPKQHRKSSKEDTVKDYGWIRLHLAERGKLLVMVVTELVLLIAILLSAWAVAGIERRLFNHEPASPCRDFGPSQP